MRWWRAITFKNRESTDEWPMILEVNWWLACSVTVAYIMVYHTWYMPSPFFPTLWLTTERLSIVVFCVFCDLATALARWPKIFSTRINSKNVFYDILWIGRRNKPIIVILFLFTFRSRFFFFFLFRTRVKHYSRTGYLWYTRKILSKLCWKWVFSARTALL